MPNREAGRNRNMKLYLMTDMEGVAGVMDVWNWCRPEGRHYDMGRAFLTGEVNAAIEGFCAAGATEIVVSDAHGAGGIDPSLLDARAELMRGWPDGYPFLLDASYDAIAWIGQHAKAGTAYAHLPHTGWFNVLNRSLNGIAIGEFGEMAFCAGALGVPVIFASGDRAFCEEAKRLVPDLEPVCVKRGTTTGTGEVLTTEQYGQFATSAVHLAPARARELIRAGAERALRRFQTKRFGLVSLPPPYELVTRYRTDAQQPRTVARAHHDSSIAALLNAPGEPQPEDG